MKNSKSDSLSSLLKKFPVISDSLITMCVFIEGEAKVTALYERDPLGTGVDFNLLNILVKAECLQQEENSISI